MYLNEEVMAELERRTGHDREVLDEAVKHLWGGVGKILRRPDIFPKGIRLSWLTLEINYMWATHHLHNMLMGKVKLNKMALEVYRPTLWLKVLDRYDATTKITSAKAKAEGAHRRARWRERERRKHNIDYRRATENFEAEVQRRVLEHRREYNKSKTNHG